MRAGLVWRLRAKSMRYQRPEGRTHPGSSQPCCHVQSTLTIQAGAQTKPRVKAEISRRTQPAGERRTKTRGQEQRFYEIVATAADPRHLNSPFRFVSPRPV